MEFFRQTEKLEKDNQWYCNNCKEFVEADKKIELYSVPPFIVFCLQRFKAHGHFFSKKLEDKITYPITSLDMTPYILSEDQKSIHGPLIYDLYGVSNHSGSLSYGHYTAYCKGEDE